MAQQNTLSCHGSLPKGRKRGSHLGERDSSHVCEEMARSARARRHVARQLRPTLYPIPSYRWKAMKESNQKKTLPAAQKMDWEDANCSVCMEYPHNDVLL
ncbi:hypothetical protein ABZP36_022129 [Zizania latifolia]